MPGARAEYERLKWLLENGKIASDEPAKLILPRLDAIEAIKNPKLRESRPRITFATDQTTKEEFAVWREAWLSKLNNNPTMFGLALIEAMKQFDILDWIKNEESWNDDANHVIGKGLHN